MYCYIRSVQIKKTNYFYSYIFGKDVLIFMILGRNLPQLTPNTAAFSVSPLLI